MKHLFVCISVKQNLFVHKCLMMLNDVKYTTFNKMFVTQMSNYHLLVISFQLMFYKTLRYRLARASGPNKDKCSEIVEIYTLIISDLVEIEISFLVFKLSQLSQI